MDGFVYDFRCLHSVLSDFYWHYVMFAKREIGKGLFSSTIGLLSISLYLFSLNPF